MTITRANSAGWGVNEKLTSLQANNIDLNTTYALDKRSGNTDTLASTVTVTGPLTITAPPTFNASVLFNNPVTSASTFTHNGATTFAAATTFNNTATHNGATTFAAATTFSALATFNNAITSNSVVSLNGAVTAADFTIGGARVKLGSRSITRVVPFVVVPSTTGWAIATVGALTSTTGCYEQTDNSASKRLVCALMIPDGAVLTSLEAFVQGAAGHSGSGPATLPSLALAIQSISSSVNFTTSGVISDTYVSQAAYESPHAITLSGLNVTIDRVTKRYTAHIVGESGSGSVAGLSVIALRVTYTATSMDDGY